MIRGNTRGIQAGGARRHFAIHPGANFLQHRKIVIGIGGAHIDGKAALIGNDIVLGAGLDHGDSHLHRAEQSRFFLKTVGMKPVDCFDRFFDRIHPGIAGGVAGDAPGQAVEHQQSLFSDRQLHFGRLANDRQIDPPQPRPGGFDPVPPGILLLRGGGDNQVKTQIGALVKMQKGRDQ